MKSANIGLAGFGTVGAGVVEGLTTHAELMASRIGIRPVLRTIADLDIETDRGVAVDADILTTDAFGLIDDPEIDIIVELIGGTGIARELVCRALRAGKSVVTANKALLAEHGDEIFSLVNETGSNLYFGASVGGGIPIIRALQESFVANQFNGLRGILNGTCNYILTRMETENLPFDVALQEAQAAGFAEADPTLDIDGFDTAHKAAILARLAYGISVPMETICVEGIRGLAAEDIAYASDLGYRIKLLAILANHDEEVEVRIHPALVPKHHMLASVNGAFNAVMVDGDFLGSGMLYGQGAGQKPTASTILGDIGDAMRDCASGMQRALPTPSSDAPPLRTLGNIVTRYYLRVNVLDKPGTLSRVSSILGDHGISIDSVMQKTEEHQGEHVPVVIVTHGAQESNVTHAVRLIDEADIVGAPTVRLRIEP
jgi:homoserine dehydrogenase